MPAWADDRAGARRRAGRPWRGPSRLRVRPGTSPIGGRRRLDVGDVTAPTVPTPPTPPTHATPPPRRILRSRSDRIVAGVAAGFGRYFNVDPVLIRLRARAAHVHRRHRRPRLPGGLAGGPRGAGRRAERGRLPPGPRIPLWLDGAACSSSSSSPAASAGSGSGLRADLFWPLVLISGGVAILWMRTRSDGTALGDGRPTPRDGRRERRDDTRPHDRRDRRVPGARALGRPDARRAVAPAADACIRRDAEENRGSGRVRRSGAPCRSSSASWRRSRAPLRHS